MFIIKYVNNLMFIHYVSLYYENYNYCIHIKHYCSYFIYCITELKKIVLSKTRLITLYLFFYLNCFLCYYLKKERAKYGVKISNQQH